MNNLQNMKVKTMKSTEKLFSTFQLFTFSTLFAAAAMAAMDTGTINKDTTTLYGGTVYTVDGNVPIKGAATRDGLTVVRRDGTAGNRVVINIPEGASLTVQGGAASGRSSAGAGIRLPSDVTLYVTGAGTLTATGGNAASGGNGAGGGNAEISGWNFKNGGGGAGGGGGGGAGAG
ncbi:MAG: hypothetical protein IJT88_07795, partial [Kiritimatiellae bacterium]|nr:hypothetical protein [Kiritimatiellia bacterium]